MSSNFQKTPWLRLERRFPLDPQGLTVEVNKAYIDIANAVNARTLGFFSSNEPINNGETWVLTSLQTKRVAQRKTFEFTSFASIAHGIDLGQVSYFTRMFGTFFDGTFWYALNYASAASQVAFRVDATSIVFVTTTPPAVTKGLITLEYINN